ncbi:unnamed protein product [Arabis nemorensis]|uniref:Uncharacterized protein n=1 Tax=Arabis nemorensis TaxID=586526 RepID=A0A565CF27_9BRAS|nr:unnamed protein product [Arabis nemorensis]
MGNGNDKDIKDEYAKSYYVVLLRKQQEIFEKQNHEGELTPHEIQSVTSTSSDH